MYRDDGPPVPDVDVDDRSTVAIFGLPPTNAFRQCCIVSWWRSLCFAHVFARYSNRLPTLKSPRARDIAATARVH